MKKTILVAALISALTTNGFSQQKTAFEKKQTETKKTTMETTDYTTRFLVEQSRAQAFKAITNFRGWWSEEIEGPTDVLNETFFYHYKDVHLCRVKLIEVIPNKKLVYEVVDNEFSFTKDKTEWIGTQLVFDISTEGNKTKIVFTHVGLVPAYECYLVCYDAWTSYIQGSLKSLITTGTGKPNPKEGGLNEELVKKWGLPTKHLNQNKMNTEKDFTTSILVDQSPAAVFKAINNPRAWWSSEIVGPTDKLNEVFDYHFEDIHRCKVKVIELVPGKKVVWQILENDFNFTKDKSEWVNTKVVYEIAEQNGKTQLTFTHVGLVPQYECYEACNQGWTHYIQSSLQKYITEGTGEPNKTGEPQTETEKKLKSEVHNEMNTENNYSTSILVDQSPAAVYAAINNARGWWQGEFEGHTDTLNEEFTYQVPGVHFSKQKVVELIPNKKVVWLVTDSHLTFVGQKDEWTNTKIQFDITTEGTKTKITFTHFGLVPAFECYGGCSGAWDALIEKSLYSYITTGKGVKVF